MIYKDIDDRGIKVLLKEDNIVISECKISLSHGIWSITEWFTTKFYMNQGYGKQTMKEAVNSLYEAFGMPEQIRYNWNGVNEYVYLWLKKHFNAVPLHPPIIDSECDSWEDHIYILDKIKLINYFKTE